MLGRADKHRKFNFWTQRPTPLAKSGLFYTLIAAFGLVGVTATQAQTLVQPEITPLEARAAKYIEFRNDIQIIDATPIDSELVSRDAHNRLASHTPDDLSSGWIAYAALVAADTPAFVESIQMRVARKKDREAFLSELRSNPRSVRNLTGAQAAIDSILTMSAKDATKINALGEHYLSTAYTLQNKGWAKKKLPQDGPSRVSEAEGYSYSRSRMATPVLPASVSDGVRQPGLNSYDRMWTPDWSGTSTTPSLNPRAEPILDRALVLAARYAVGDLSEPIVNGYAKSENIRRCFYTAKLNFDQCIAATRTPTEEVFCIGRHGLNEVSGCVGWIANAGAR